MLKYKHDMRNAIRNSSGVIVIPDRSHIEPFGPDSVLKPVGELAQVIQATSPGDMLLFMIALGRQEKKDLTNPTPVQ